MVTIFSIRFSSMHPFSYSIAQDIFKHFPEYSRGVVIARELQNGMSPGGLILLLRSAETDIRQKLNLDQLSTEPRLNSWREAFRKAGMKPADFRPSVEALARRVLHGNEIPSINTLVDIGNIISLRYLLPAGGHSIDHLAEEMQLRPAKGDEEFIPFGSEEMEHPELGEIILAAGNTVLTRRWIWRQANFTLTLPETKSLVFNLDCLPPVGESELQKIASEMMEMIQKYCGGKSEYFLLKRNDPKITITT
jgi:DNA/RNA-binding domain of Phe-tRNA-synthetase-like protein